MYHLIIQDVTIKLEGMVYLAYLWHRKTSRKRESIIPVLPVDLHETRLAITVVNCKLTLVRRWLKYGLVVPRKHYIV